MMNEMKIRKTQPEDLEEVLLIYETARDFMIRTNNPNQWGKHWPPKELIKQDIKEQKSYVCIQKNKILAVFYFEIAQDPTYDKIYEGNWIDNKKNYGVVHRIASSRIVKGAASYCMEWAYSQCKNIKIDTHKQNIPMQNMLKKLGYKYCGIIYTHDGTERLAFQKC